MMQKTPNSMRPGLADYFNRAHPFRRLKGRLAYLAAALAAVWVAGHAVIGQKELYNPGEVSAPHAFIANNCNACHSEATSSSLLSRVVPDRACETCHAGPVHHANQIFDNQPGGEPKCGSCHREHEGPMFATAFMSSSNCTQCHSSLQQAAVPPARFVTNITSFQRDHPEFRIIREGRKDAATIKLNHKKHLRPDLPGPGGRPTKLECGSCHRVKEDGTAMMPIEFERDCESCHSLAFNERITSPAPHETPDIVEAFVRTAFSKYAGSRSGEWKNDVEWNPPRRLPEFRRMVDEAPRDLPEWLEIRVRDSSQLLFQKKCVECHEVEDRKATMPVIVKPEIPQRWLTHSRFAHTPHRMLQCTSCHSGAPESAQTMQVLLPDRATCLQCHNGSAGAPSNCVTCHAYHDKTIPTPRAGSLTPGRAIGNN